MPAPSSFYRWAHRELFLYAPVKLSTLVAEIDVSRNQKGVALIGPPSAGSLHCQPHWLPVHCSLTCCCLFFFFNLISHTFKSPCILEVSHGPISFLMAFCWGQKCLQTLLYPQTLLGHIFELVSFQCKEKYQVIVFKRQEYETCNSACQTYATYHYHHHITIILIIIVNPFHHRRVAASIKSKKNVISKQHI